MALIGCPACRAEVSAAAAYCPKCGHPIAGLGAKFPEKQRAPLSAKQKWAIGLAITAAFLILLGTTNEPDNSTTQTNQTAGKSASGKSPAAENFDAPTKSLITVNTRKTRFGVLQAKDDGSLLFQGKPVPFSNYVEGFGQVAEFGEFDGVLAELNTPVAKGVNYCPVEYVFLMASTKGLFVSKPFAKCSEVLRVTPLPNKFVIRSKTEAFSVGVKGVEKISLDQERKEELQFEVDYADTNPTNIFRPLVKADMRMYKWCGILEQTDQGTDDTGKPYNTYVVQLGNGRYRFSALASSVAEVDASQLRIDGFICITGRYIANMPYETVGGANGQMPMLTAFRVAAHN